MLARRVDARSLQVISLIKHAIFTLYYRVVSANYIIAIRIGAVSIA